MLLSFFVDTVDRPSIQLVSRLASLEAEQKAIRERSTVSHIQEEKPGEPMANVLMRGAYDKPGEKVAAAGFPALHRHAG